MNGVRQGWLIAMREMRERSRSRAFRLSVVLMIVTVAAMLILPAVLTPGSTSDVGLTGSAPPALAAAISQQAHAVGTTARVHRYASPAAAEQAVRQGRLDVLVEGSRRLEWKGRADEQLKAVLTGAIQLVTLRERATAAGVSPRALAGLLAPVPVRSIELGPAAGRGPGDETAVLAMTAVLFFCISIFGSLVLTGVLEEKSSRVVEVLLARVPARVLLAGKIAGIGLLGLAQIGVTALTALIAVTAFHSIHVPAIRGAVLAWVVIWFVLGYILYATIYGALGSLGSRVEDAQSVAGPISVVLVVAYFASFAMIAQPTSALARAISYFPLTAPMAMPGRIAMGATTWWEPLIAAALTLAATLVLVRIAGRLYTSAILHGGPRLSLRGAWQGRSGQGPATASAYTTTAPQSADVPERATTTTARPDVTSHRLLMTVLVGAGLILGTVTAALTSDVIVGVIAGAGFIAVAVQLIKLRSGRTRPPVAHH